ncbi:MAG: hypothetical protein KTR26_11565 [Flammeovirgaceae bacterium]|nr:hypothetical protein [Flammeovirgaceae bacterium]
MEDYSVFASGLFLVFGLAISLFLIIAQWKIFEKAGKPGWACLVPFYNIIVLLEIVGKPWWWLLLMFVPIANIVVGIWAINLLSKSFGKDEGFTLGLLFLSFIFYPILGFGSAEYKGPAGLGFQNESYSEILDQE